MILINDIIDNLIKDDNKIYKKIEIDIQNFDIDKYGYLLKSLTINQLYVRPAKYIYKILDNIDPNTKIIIKRPLNKNKFNIDEIIHYHKKHKNMLYKKKCTIYKILFKNNIYNIEYEARNK